MDQLVGNRDGERVLASMRVVWARAIPHLSFDADLPWRDSGVDSLRSLQFVLMLEEELGEPIPLELLTPETTPRTLAEALLAQEVPEIDERPALVMIPGLLGDGPVLAQFRRAMQDAVRCDMLVMPDIDTPAEILGDVTATVRLLVRQIVALQPTGPLMLAGYSMGGILAFEAAQQLRAQGREIALLVLLDPFLAIDPRKPFELEDGAVPLPSAGVVSFSNWRMSPAALLGRVTFGAYFLSGALDAARRHTLKARDRLAPDTHYWRRHRLMGRFRWRALRRWRPEPWRGAALLAISREAKGHYDLARWRALAPQARRIDLPTSHLGLFEPMGMALLRPALIEALAACRETA